MARLRVLRLIQVSNTYFCDVTFFVAVCCGAFWYVALGCTSGGCFHFNAFVWVLLLRIVYFLCCGFHLCGMCIKKAVAVLPDSLVVLMVIPNKGGKKDGDYVDLLFIPWL